MGIPTIEKAIFHPVTLIITCMHHYYKKKTSTLFLALRYLGSFNAQGILVDYITLSFFIV